MWADRHQTGCAGGWQHTQRSPWEQIERQASVREARLALLRHLRHVVRYVPAGDGGGGGGDGGGGGRINAMSPSPLGLI